MEWSEEAALLMTVVGHGFPPELIASLRTRTEAHAARQNGALVVSGDVVHALWGLRAEFHAVVACFPNVRRPKEGP